MFLGHDVCRVASVPNLLGHPADPSQRRHLPRGCPRPLSPDLRSDPATRLCRGFGRGFRASFDRASRRRPRAARRRSARSREPPRRASHRARRRRAMRALGLRFRVDATGRQVRGHRHIARRSNAARCWNTKGRRGLLEAAVVATGASVVFLLLQTHHAWFGHRSCPHRIRLGHPLARPGRRTSPRPGLRRRAVRSRAEDEEPTAAASASLCMQTKRQGPKYNRRHARFLGVAPHTRQASPRITAIQFT